MLVTLTEILKLAEEKKCAVGAFNTPNLECVNAVIAAAEALDVPVIISHAELHEEVSPLEKIGPVMVQAAKAAKVPVLSVQNAKTVDGIENNVTVIPAVFLVLSVLGAIMYPITREKFTLLKDELQKKKNGEKYSTEGLEKII